MINQKIKLQRKQVISNLLIGKLDIMILYLLSGCGDILLYQIEFTFYKCGK